MSRKKVQPTEQEVEVQVAKKPVKETFATRWFKEKAVNDKEDLKVICNLTARSAEEQFNLYLEKGNTEVFAVVFYATFMSILEFMQSQQKRFPTSFDITICNSITLGYDNNDDEENEKVGNFMPWMMYEGINRVIVDDGKIEDDKTTNNFIGWKQLNIKKNVECYKEIQERAYDKLKTEYKINLRTSEAVIPLFCIFLDHISNVLKMKYAEADGTQRSEVSMNILGLFDIFYSFNSEKNVEVYEYKPGITMKLGLKSDTIAGKE